MSSALASILAPDGAIARRLGELYEPRRQQLEMAAAVENALHQGHHLMVEAGTGVGKSFAYLLPAVQYALEKNKCVVISTHTISLQEQLIEKDIPLIQSIWPDEFTAVLVKGRGNYLCRRRLEQARSHQGMLLDETRQRKSLWTIEQWAAKTADGSLAALPALPDPSVWERVNAEQGNCLGKKCTFYNNCFWQSAKRRMQGARILVVNHALFFSDMALRMAGVRYLPPYDVAILDEAHTIEQVAAEHFGLKASEAAVRYQLRWLYDPKRGKGMLNVLGSSANEAISEVVDLYSASQDFFDRCADWQQSYGKRNGRIHEPGVVDNDLSPALSRLSVRLKAMASKMKSPEEKLELTSRAARVSELAQTIKAVVSQELPEAVYWMEIGRRASRNVTICAAPIKIAAGLRDELFAKLHSVVMCSATMCTAGAGRQGHRDEDAPPEGDRRFAYIRSRLGADQAESLAVGSPFDFSRQATLYIESDLPHPGDDAHFLPAACEKILQYLQQTHGGAFVLFTSYAMMTAAADRLRGALEQLQLPLLVQGEEAPRGVLLERFRATANSVLFGTSSFWQGIDVRGQALRNVIIVKLPFSVPDEPIIEARLEAITRDGGNPFMEYSIPEAIIRLKQGFGRLIRSKTDTGIVVVLDSRLRTRRYGRLFLDALPNCKTIVVGGS